MPFIDNLANVFKFFYHLYDFKSEITKVALFLIHLLKNA